MKFLLDGTYDSGITQPSPTILANFRTFVPAKSIEHEILSLRFVALIITGKLMQFLVYWSETD